MDDPRQKEIRQNRRNENRIRQKHRVVFTNGCFDLFHVGHLMVLQYAKDLSRNGILVVGVNSDKSVRRLKGEGRPIIPEEDRCEILEELKCVDEVRMFKEDTPFSLIEEIQPDIVVKGRDWKGKEDDCVPESFEGYVDCGCPLIGRMGPNFNDRDTDVIKHIPVSTSGIIEKIRGDKE